MLLRHSGTCQLLASVTFNDGMFFQSLDFLETCDTFPSTNTSLTYNYVHMHNHLVFRCIPKDSALSALQKVERVSLCRGWKERGPPRYLRTGRPPTPQLAGSECAVTLSFVNKLQNFRCRPCKTFQEASLRIA